MTALQFLAGARVCLLIVITVTALALSTIAGTVAWRFVEELRHRGDRNRVTR